MYCVGLTGNIGSGKSTVAAIFASKGIVVIKADDVSREVTTPQGEAYHAIISHFGPTCITTQQELNRKVLRQIIFNDAKERVWLEQLLHPIIRRHIMQKVNHLKSQYTIIEIPLLTLGKEPYINRVLLILANIKLQLSRIIQRDQIALGEAKAMLASQATVKQLKQMADDIIINNGSYCDLKAQVEKLHQQYLILAHQKLQKSH